MRNHSAGVVLKPLKYCNQYILWLVNVALIVLSIKVAFHWNMVREKLILQMDLILSTLTIPYSYPGLKDGKLKHKNAYYCQSQLINTLSNHWPCYWKKNTQVSVLWPFHLFFEIDQNGQVDTWILCMKIWKDFASQLCQPQVHCSSLFTCKLLVM